MKIFVVLAVLCGSVAFGQCNYCTSIDEALKNPNQVEYLDLRAQGLTEIPRELNTFVHLKHLDVSENSIVRFDVNQVQLGKLQSLNLSFNPGIDIADLMGIGEAFPELKKLELRRCSLFTLSPFVSELDSLQLLDLAENNLNTLPDALESMPNLKQLYASDNILSNTNWALNLWFLEELDVSTNPKLNLDDLGHALLFKTHLKSIKLTPAPQYKGIPKVFSDVACEELILKANVFGDMNKSLATNKTLKNLVFEGGTIEDPAKMYNWLNQFAGLETIEFQNMNLPEGFSNLVSSESLVLDACSLENESEIAKVKPNVNLELLNFDAAADVAPTIANKSNVLSTSNRPEQMASEAMVNNTLPSVVKPKAAIEWINPAEPQKIELKNSVYYIPENAFLAKNGSVYTGNVELRITEYNDALDNALAGAPMTYRTDEGNEIFSSSGMIDFRAYGEKGEELQPNPDNLIQVELNDLQPQEDASLYAYSEADSNWVDIGKPVASNSIDTKQRILDSLNRLPDNVFYTVNEQKPGFFLEYKRNRRDPYTLKFHHISAGRVFNEAESKKSLNARHADQHWIAKKGNSWKMDLLMNDSLADIFKSIRKSQGSLKRFNKKWKNRLPATPQIIRDLHLEPNFVNDNYTLSFKYFEKSVSFPVFFDEEGSINKVQLREKKRFADFHDAEMKAKKSQEEYEAKMEVLNAESAQVARERQAEFLANFPIGLVNEQRTDNLRFSLPSFGLMNCDFFSRVIPTLFVRSSRTAADEKGEEIEVPNDIRVVIPEENTYVSTTPSQVPQYDNKRTLMFFVISATEIAIIKGWEQLKDGLSKPIVRRVSTEGNSSDEIRSAILGL